MRPWQGGWRSALLLGRRRSCSVWRPRVMLPFKSLSALLLLAACGVALAQPSGKPAAGSCRTRPDIVGRCFSVRGRLSLYNGTPSVRLWRVGTRRILGVTDTEESSGRPERPALPESIMEQLGWEKEMYGDFVVCPLTRSRPGVMQMVCVESGRNLFVRERQ